MNRVSKVLQHFTKSNSGSLKRFCTQAESSGVLIEESDCGNYLVTLNRPKALNALNEAMISELTPFYQTLIDQKKPCVVVVKGAGGKAFCAGGDVRHLWDLGKAGSPLSEVTHFFKVEYILDHMLATLPSHICNISLLNGITMGGGVGISVHGKYRVVTDKSLFAMPETGIGFYTDVGGAHFLPRLQPNGLGMYLALTGQRLKGSDCLHAGIGSHFVSDDDLNQLEQDLLNCESPQQVDAILQKWSKQKDELPKFSLEGNLNDINKYFTLDSVEEMFAQMEKDADNEFAGKTLGALKSVSPTSLKVIYRALQYGKEMNLKDVLDMEFDIVTNYMRGGDFYEGVRAVLVDKDKNARWNPATLEEVKDSDIDGYFPRFSK